MPLLLLIALPLAAREPAPAAWAEIRVLDAETGRGIPLVELVTVNQVTFVTDNAGRIAFNEPGLMGKEVFFTVRAHGYEAKKDGFGFTGVRVTPEAGKVKEIKLARRIVAERLCRLTGEGLYRDTLLLGHKPPLEPSPNPGQVAGQDSVQAVRYRGEIYWLWGDTSQMKYPLGLFRTAGARTPIPKADFDPASGIAFDYFTGKNGFARAMMPLPERPEGVIWIDGVCVVPDEKGAEKLAAHYSRRKGLTGQLEHGITVFDDEKKIFLPAKELPLSEQWRFPQGHAVLHEEGGKKYLLFANPAPNVRVPATLEDLLNPDRYESFTSAKEILDGKPTGPEVDANGTPVWKWRSDLPPVTPELELAWLAAGKLKPEHARFCPADAASPKDRIRPHRGTVQWNAYRKRWVMIFGQLGGKGSFLGEVWYAEAEQPTGPFAKAVKIASHERQSFYNVCHHPILDRDGGRVIYFEGTYTAEFSGNPVKTPRYDYNQILYRLDLDSPKLKDAR